MMYIKKFISTPPVLVVLIIILIYAILFLISFALTWYFNESGLNIRDYTKQDIDFKPIKAVALSNPITEIHDIGELNLKLNDVSGKKSVYLMDGYYELNGTDCYISLFKDSEVALQTFNSIIKQENNNSVKVQINEINGKGERYWCSYIKRGRNPEAFYFPTGRFSSEIIFLKHNLLVIITSNIPSDKPTNGQSQQMINTIANILEDQSETISY